MGVINNAEREIEFLDAGIKGIMEDPGMGEPKRGDIARVYVRKFKIGRELFWVAYEFGDSEIDLLAIGHHDNFYRDLKRYLK